MMRKLRRIREVMSEPLGLAWLLLRCCRRATVAASTAAAVVAATGRTLRRNRRGNMLKLGVEKMQRRMATFGDRNKTGSIGPESNCFTLDLASDSCRAALERKCGFEMHGGS